MSLENELNSGLNELKEQKNVKKSQKIDTKKSGENKISTWIKAHKSHVVTGVFFIFLFGVYIPYVNRTKNVSNQANIVEQPVKQNIQEKAVEQPIKQNTQEKQEIVKKTTDNNLQSDNNKTIQKQSADIWGSNIEYLLEVRQTNVRLDMKDPIVEIGNLNFANNKRLNLAEQNAIVEPVYFEALDNDIILKIKIIKADEPKVSITKSYNLSKYGFNPTYFDDCIVYNDKVYLPGEQLLFFSIVSIKKQDNWLMVRLKYMDEEIEIRQKYDSY